MSCPRRIIYFLIGFYFVTTLLLACGVLHVKNARVKTHAVDASVEEISTRERAR